MGAVRLPKILVVTIHAFLSAQVRTGGMEVQRAPRGGGTRLGCGKHRRRLSTRRV